MELRLSVVPRQLTFSLGIIFDCCGTGKQKYIMTIIKGMSGFRQHQMPFVSIKPTNRTYNEAGYTKTFVLPCADSHYELKIV